MIVRNSASADLFVLRLQVDEALYRRLVPLDAKTLGLGSLKILRNSFPTGNLRTQVGEASG
jgi:hypothetical protein